MTESESSLLAGQIESRLSLAALITVAESAMMPLFVFGVDRAEPPTAGLAVICSCGIARFVHWRYRLAGANYVSGFCLILLLQHSPSIHRDSTRVSGVAARRKRQAWVPGRTSPVSGVVSMGRRNTEIETTYK